MLGLVAIQIWNSPISDWVRGSRFLLLCRQTPIFEGTHRLGYVSLAVLWAGWDRPMEDDNCHGALHRRMNIDQNSILLRLGRSPIQQALIYTKCPSRSFKRRRVVNKRQQLG